MSEVLIRNIMDLIQDTNISDEVVSNILQQLENFKVEVNESDFYIVAFAIRNVDSEIKNTINVIVLPAELNNIFVQRVCGEVFHAKYLRSELPENLSEETIIKQMSLGDSTVSYDTSKSENKLLGLINYLRSYGKGELLCYRKLTW